MARFTTSRDGSLIVCVRVPARPCIHHSYCNRSHIRGWSHPLRAERAAITSAYTADCPERQRRAIHADTAERGSNCAEAVVKRYDQPEAAQSRLLITGRCVIAQVPVYQPRIRIHLARRGYEVTDAVESVLRNTAMAAALAVFRASDGREIGIL
jgi:hypothetical protein